MDDIALKVKSALDEARILVLSSQVLLATEWSSVFQERFVDFPSTSRALTLAALAVTVMATLLLTWPGAYHRIVLNGADDLRFQQFIFRVMSAAHLPLAIGLGLVCYVATSLIAGTGPGLAESLLITGVALVLWYAPEIVELGQKEPKKEKTMPPSDPAEKEAIKLKIEHVLTEARVVLPGAQALLGFQFAAMFTKAFESLPESSRVVHVASLFALTLSGILLITPASYHRVVEKGEFNEHFHRVASGVMLVALIPLAAGFAGDMFVVVRQVTESIPFAILGAAGVLVVAFGLWFALSYYYKTHPPHGGREQFSAPAGGQRQGV